MVSQDGESEHADVDILQGQKQFKHGAVAFTDGTFSAFTHKYCVSSASNYESLETHQV